MKWIEIRVESDKDITEEVSMALLEAGASGTNIQNPDEIRSLIDAAGAKELADYRDFSQILEKYSITAYFPADFIFDDLKGALNERFGEINFLWRLADDSEWSGKWKQYYKPFNLTKGIRVVPSWETGAKAGPDTIIMDPGMAFGTGTHESTSLCAALIEENIEEDDNVLDIGTGTGILSIVASKNGAKHIIALDIDPAAVKTAKQNFEINKTANAEVFLGELKDLESHFKKNSLRAPLKELRFDMIAANIVSDVIISLAGDMRKYLKEGGSLVCSGIIIEREKDVADALSAAGFKNLEIRHRNEWTAIFANA